MTPSTEAWFECSLRSRLRTGLFVLSVAAPGLFFVLPTLRIATASVLERRDGLWEVQKALALDPANPEIHRRLGILECCILDSPDAAQGLEQLRQATELAPLQSLYWWNLGSACESNGDLSCADAAFERALSLNPMDPQAHWVVANYYLRTHRSSTALAQFRRLLELGLESDYTAPTFEVCLRAVDDPEAVFRQVLAGQGPALELRYVDYLSLHGQPDAAYRVWGLAVANTPPFPLALAKPYLERLLDLHRYQEAWGVWQDLERLGIVKRPVEDDPNNLVFNGGFEQEPLNAGFDWHFGEASFLSFDSADPGAHHGKRCLRLDFTVQRNEAYQPADQLVPVVPGREYELAAYARSENITSDSGPGLRVSDPLHPENLDVSTETTVGTTPWHPIHLAFRPGPETHFVVLSVWRPRGRTFPSEISGSFWLDDVTLKPASPAARTDAAKR
jgi:tetratricopeptide (TPR) repeat protein